MNHQHIDELRSLEKDQLERLNQLVVEAVEEEKLLSDKLFGFEDTNPSFASKVSDRIAKFGGSWYFIMSFCGVMAVWIAINIWLLDKPFDPFPFILLNLALSTIAALQAPVIMMSQNRKEEKDRQRAINDYMINLKAEIEVRNIDRKIDLLIAEQMKTMFEIQNLQLEMIKEIKQAVESQSE